jgi:hypothetical protein
MKQLICSLCLLAFLICACKTKKGNDIPNNNQSNINDTTTFFDIKGFFENEVKDVTTTPYFIYTTIKKDDNKKDSMPLTTKDFVQLAQEFLEKDITQKDVKHFYKEDIFRDLSTKSVTFDYSTSNKDLYVQSIDVLLDEETNKVKFILIRANKTTNDSTIITQLNWNKGKSFLINKSVLKNDGTKYSTQQYVSWNNE